MAEARTCPACGAPMDFRLGEYQCTRCNQTVAAQAEQAKPKSTVQWDPGAQYRQAPPPPAPSESIQYQGQNHYSNPDAPDNSDPLRTEKMLYLRVSLLNGVLSSYLAYSNPQASTLLGAFSPGVLISMALGGMLLGLGINVLALFFADIWLKWTCIACSGCGMLVLLGSLLGLGAMAAGAGQGNPITNVIAVGMSSWLIWILWRDIQNKQGDYS